MFIEKYEKDNKKTPKKIINFHNDKNTLLMQQGGQLTHYEQWFRLSIVIKELVINIFAIRGFFQFVFH